MSATMGITIQRQSGFATSTLVEGSNPTPVELGGTYTNDDLAVSPFIGADFQLMAPALDLPSRPRFFVGVEILPTFAPSRDLAYQGAPDCPKGPEANAICARDEDGSQRRSPFDEDSINGLGTGTTVEQNVLTYGLAAGVSFPFEVVRPLRFKPVAAFMSYRLDATGLVVQAACDPTTICTDYTPFPGFPSVPGFMREMILEAERSRRFYTIGPGFDLEMDAGRFGEFGGALYLGMRAYKVLGDRTIEYGTSQSYDDQIGQDTAYGAWAVTVDPWIYRAHVGFRVQWLGKIGEGS